MFINFVCIGFKLAQAKKILDTSFQERENFCLDLLRMIEIEDPDFLKKNRKPKNFKTNKGLLKKFIAFNDDNLAIFNKLKVAALGFNWAIYGDIFAVFGYFNYGEHPVYYRGHKTSCFISQYGSQKVEAVWPKTKRVPYEKIRFYTLGKKNDTKYALVEVDDRMLKDEHKMENLTVEILRISAKQNKYVSGLSDLQKVDKMINITYYAFRGFFGNSWEKLYEKTRKNIEIFGDKFIKKPVHGSQGDQRLSSAEKYKQLDPRNDCVR